MLWPHCYKRTITQPRNMKLKFMSSVVSASKQRSRREKFSSVLLRSASVFLKSLDKSKHNDPISPHSFTFPITMFNWYHDYTITIPPTPLGIWTHSRSRMAATNNSNKLPQLKYPFKAPTSSVVTQFFSLRLKYVIFVMKIILFNKITISPLMNFTQLVASQNF